MNSVVPEIVQLRTLVIRKVAQRKGHKVDKSALDGQLGATTDDVALYEASTTYTGSLFGRFRLFAKFFDFFR